MPFVLNRNHADQGWGAVLRMSTAKVTGLNSVSITPREMTIDFSRLTEGGDANRVHCDRSSTDGLFYAGKCCDRSTCFDPGWVKLVSPFYFAPYDHDDERLHNEGEALFV